MRGKTQLIRCCKFLLNIALVLLSFISIYPIIWVLYSSLKAQKEFSLNILSLPRELHLGNYYNALMGAKLYQNLLDSVYVTVISVCLIIIVGFVTGYFLARFSFRGRNLLYLMFLFGLLVPVYGLLVPIFIEYRNLHLLNNLTALVVPESAFVLPVIIFLIESFVKGIPIEIEEASHIDGTGTLSNLVRVVLPMCGPVISTCTILGFLNVWNEFPFALVLVSKQHLKTLPVGLTNFVGQYTVNYPVLMAGIDISIIPVILMYLFLSRRIIQGMVAGAVKG